MRTGCPVGIGSSPGITARVHWDAAPNDDEGDALLGASKALEIVGAT